MSQNENPALLQAGALSYERDYLFFLCSPRPAYSRDSLDTGQFFIKQLKALKRAWLFGTHQNTSFNPAMLAGDKVPVNPLTQRSYKITEVIL